MSSIHDRRSFLKSVALAGSGATLDLIFASIASATVWPSGAGPYGPLVPMSPVDGGLEALALPRGFSYRVLSFGRRVMSDGIRTPPASDGMAAFDVGGFVRLLRNHEVKTLGSAVGNLQDSYDSRGDGAVTTIIVDPITRAPVRDFLTLSGTVANCSGGPTPWNSWISCEESVDGPQTGFDQRHGYCFEVPAAADRQVSAIPIRGMGRFNHEAVAIDPSSGVAYMTEDEGDAGFYRYVPQVPGNFSLGGRLQMLAIEGSPRFDTIRNQRVGDRLPVRWGDIPDPDPASRAELRAVYEQGRAAGGARFRRLEGAVYGNGSVYFSATSGGNAALGQIWRYTPDSVPVSPPSRTGRRRAVARFSQRPAEERGALTLLYESADAAALKAPDNLCLSLRGSLLICEDSTAGAQYVRCLTPSGELFDLVRNNYPGLEHSEMAGVTFSPDGETLFLNIFGVPMTVAIWGPWGLGPL